MRNAVLTEYIDQFQNLLVDTDIIAIKDTNGLYAFATPLWLKCYGFTDLNEIIGKNDRQILTQSSSFKESVEHLDQECLNTKKRLVAHAMIDSVNQGPRLFVIQKNLIIRNGKTLGIRDIYRPFIARNFMYQLLNQFPDDVPYTELLHAPDLTDREQAILFLLLLGYTPKLIAWILQKYSQKAISAKTVSNIIYQQLYPKFKVNTIASLTKTALKFNIDLQIPLLLKEHEFIIRIE